MTAPADRARRLGDAVTPGSQRCVYPAGRASRRCLLVRVRLPKRSVFLLLSLALGVRSGRSSAKAAASAVALAEAFATLSLAPRLPTAVSGPPGQFLQRRIRLRPPPMHGGMMRASFLLARRLRLHAGTTSAAERGSALSSRCRRSTAKPPARNQAPGQPAQGASDLQSSGDARARGAAASAAWDPASSRCAAPDSGGP